MPVEAPIVEAHGCRIPQIGLGTMTLKDDSPHIAEHFGFELDWTLKADYGGASGLIFAVRTALDANKDPALQDKPCELKSCVSIIMSARLATGSSKTRSLSMASCKVILPEDRGCLRRVSLYLFNKVVSSASR